jgi:hypothetical protein
MNREQRNIYRREWNRRQQNVEKRWRGKVKTALDQQVNFLVSYLKTEGLYAGKLNLPYNVPYEGLAKVLQALYVNAGVFEANVEYSRLRKEEGQKYRGFGYNKEWTEAIRAYFAQNIFSKLVLPMTEETKEWIHRILNEATEKGWGVDETVRHIMTKAKDINRKRAKRIVRTESVRAMNVGALQAIDKSSLVMDKVWIDAKDDRERPSHKVCGRQAPLDLNEPFANGLMYPGDPEGGAKETVNCRCKVAGVPRRDAQGRVIRKPKLEAVNPATGQQVQVTDHRPKPNAFGQVIGGVMQGLVIGEILNDILNENEQ